MGQGSGFSPPPFLAYSEFRRFSRYNSWPYFLRKSFRAIVRSETYNLKASFPVAERPNLLKQASKALVIETTMGPNQSLLSNLPLVRRKCWITSLLYQRRFDEWGKPDSRNALESQRLSCQYGFLLTQWKTDQFKPLSSDFVWLQNEDCLELVLLSRRKISFFLLSLDCALKLHKNVLDYMEYSDHLILECFWAILGMKCLGNNPAFT